MTMSRKDRVASELRHRVLTLDLAPGQAVDEVALAKEYELSRTPLREILQRLCSEGYFSATANKGASVTLMDLATLRNFFQSAPLVYAAIARLATEHASVQSIAELKRIQQCFSRSVRRQNVRDMSLHNHRFHAQLGVMAQSPYLVPSLERLLIDHTRMSHVFYGRGDEQSLERTHQACQQHDEMIDAIERCEPARTVELTLAHWELSRDEMDQYVMPQALPMDDVPGLSLEATP